VDNNGSIAPESNKKKERKKSHGSDKLVLPISFLRANSYPAVRPFDCSLSFKFTRKEKLNLCVACTESETVGSTVG
jgi:hypothetical protein